MVTCRTVRFRQKKNNKKKKTCHQLQRGTASHKVTQPVGLKVSLPFTLSTRLAFNTHELFEDTFEPLFVRADDA